MPHINARTVVCAVIGHGSARGSCSACAGRRNPGRSLVAGARLTEQTLEEEMALAGIVLHGTPIGMHPNTGESIVPAGLSARNGGG